jgi:hypothetical protein
MPQIARTARRPSRLPAALRGVAADFDPNRWNAGQLRHRGEQAGAQLRDELVAAHAEMLALLGA